MGNLLAADTKDLRPLWSRLAWRFPGGSECLSAFIALEAAEVLAETKPAPLISIPNRERSCGRNLYSLWIEHGHELLADTPLEVCELVDRGTSLMILFSHKIHFARHLLLLPGEEEKKEDQSGLSAAIKGQFTPLTSVAFMAFVLRYMPCVVVGAAMRQEFNTWKWFGVAFLYQTVLAWGAALVIYQGGRLLGF